MLQYCNLEVMNMRDSEIELFFKRAKGIELKAGNYYPPIVAACMSLSFIDEDVQDFSVFSNSIGKQFKDSRISAYINQVKVDKIDLSLIIQTDPVIVLCINELECAPETIKLFFETQPKDKPILLSLNIIKDEEIHDHLLEEKLKSRLVHSIQIQSWNGRLFESSLAI